MESHPLDLLFPIDRPSGPCLFSYPAPLSGEPMNLMRVPYQSRGKGLFRSKCNLPVLAPVKKMSLPSSATQGRGLWAPPTWQQLTANKVSHWVTGGQESGWDGSEGFLPEDERWRCESRACHHNCAQECHSRAMPEDWVLQHSTPPDGSYTVSVLRGRSLSFGRSDTDIPLKLSILQSYLLSTLTSRMNLCC